MHGTGVFTWPDGRKFEGEYKNDRRDGKGKLTEADGTEIIGTWKAGKQIPITKDIDVV